MTVIVWDGTTLAADKRAVNQGYAYTTTKIFRQDADTILGLSGCMSRGLQIVQWIVAGRNPATFPKEEENDGSDYATVMVVHSGGRVERFESREGPLILESPYHAIGSARDFALMAMHLGADARQAVELTCELSVDCGNGIDTLTFDVPVE